MMKFSEDWNKANDKDPDLYIIGLQEVGTATLPKIGTGPVGNSLWHLRLKEILTPREYILIRCKSMQAIRIFCFAKRKHLLHLRKIEAEQTRTGLGGLLVVCFLNPFWLLIDGLQSVSLRVTKELSAFDLTCQDVQFVL